MQGNGQNQDVSLESIDEIVGENLFYRTFFNKDADYYDKRYKRITTGETVIFNAYAFFFGFIWLAYRKMYVELLVLIGIMAVIDTFLIFVLNIDNSAFDRIINIIWAAVMGCLANKFYIQKASRTVQKAKETYNNTGDQLDYLEKTGGVSVAAPIIVAALFIGLIVGVMMLTEYVENSFY